MSLPGIVAIEDVSGDLECPSMLKRGNDHIPILTGNDTTYAAHRINGGNGIISALSNLIPKEMVILEKAIHAGEYHKIKHLHEVIFPLAKAVFCETNPVSLKYAISCKYKSITPSVRLPLAEITHSARQLIHKILKEFETEKHKTHT